MMRALLSQSHAIGKTDKHVCTKSDENRPGRSCGLGLIGKGARLVGLGSGVCVCEEGQLPEEGGI